jgi:hypothetical protein
MTQKDVDRAVSRATGESLATVRRHGFSIVEVYDDDDPESDVAEVVALRIIDWDQQQTLQRRAA